MADENTPQEILDDQFRRRMRRSNIKVPGPMRIGTVTTRLTEEGIDMVLDAMSAEGLRLAPKK